MADNISALDAALATIILAAKEIAGVKYPRSILTAPDGSDLTPLTDAELRATAVPVSGTLALDAPTLAALETISTGGLTDAQLRASAVPVSGPITDAQIRATALPVSGPLTDAELRATAVPVSGTLALDAPTLAALETIQANTGGLTDAQLRASAVPVSGPITDVQLRAADVPTSLRSLYYPASAGKPTTTYTLRLRGTLAAAAGQVEATVALFVTDNIITT